MGYGEADDKASLARQRYCAAPYDGKQTGTTILRSEARTTIWTVRHICGRITLWIASASFPNLAGRSKRCLGHSGWHAPSGAKADEACQRTPRRICLQYQGQADIAARRAYDWGSLGKWRTEDRQYRCLQRRSQSIGNR